MTETHTNTMPADRWYVLAILTIVYALNIADRFSISTLIEPIRLELHLSDSGVAFLTGVALAVFYVTVGMPVAALADRTNRRTSPTRRGLSASTAAIASESTVADRQRPATGLVEKPFRKLPLQAAKRSRLDSEWSEDVAEAGDATDATGEVRA